MIFLVLAGFSNLKLTCDLTNNSAKRSKKIKGGGNKICELVSLKNVEAKYRSTAIGILNLLFGIWK